MKYWALAFLLISCNPSKRAERTQRKLISEKPEVVLPIIREAFPVPVVQIDTLVQYRDTTIYVECPQGNLSPFKAQKTISVRYVYVEKKVEDSAKLRAYTLIIDSLRRAAVNKTPEMLQDAPKRPNYWWLLILIPIVLKIILKQYGNKT